MGLPQFNLQVASIFKCGQLGGNGEWSPQGSQLAVKIDNAQEQ